MADTNPGFISTLGTDPAVRITDNTDNIHSGIIIALNEIAGGNFAVSGFDITQAVDGDGNTEYQISGGGKVLRDGLLVTVSGATLTNLDVTPRSDNDWYATLVVNSSNALAMRTGASSISTAAVSVLSAGDIPVAVVKYVAGSNANVQTRPVQFLGKNLTDRGFSVLDNGSETVRMNADGTLTKGSATLTLPSSTGTIALTSDITYTSAISQGNAGLVPSGGVATANIADDAVTYAKMQNVSATNRILGRDSSGAGVVEEITPANVVTMLGIEAGATADQCAPILQAGPTMALLGVVQACGDYDCGVDDSGWDYDPEYETGRLIFEVDNSCIPDMTTQRVNTFWTNTGTAEVDEDAPIADKFELMGNYPNPFNPETKIRFSTEKNSNVEVTIYSILGEKINVVQSGQLDAGTYDISWFGQDSRGNKVPSGVYFYEVKSDNRNAKGKMLLLK